jgi:hypothetical protein
VVAFGSYVRGAAEEAGVGGRHAAVPAPRIAEPLPA